MIGVKRLPALACRTEELREDVQPVRFGFDAFDLAHGVETTVPSLLRYHKESDRD